MITMGAAIMFSGLVAFAAGVTVGVFGGAVYGYGRALENRYDPWVQRLREAAMARPAANDNVERKRTLGAKQIGEQNASSR